MSVDYYLACNKCREITPIATCGMSGWFFFCTPEKGPVFFIARHQSCLDEIRIVKEQGPEWENYKRVEYKSSMDVET